MKLTTLILTLALVQVSARGFGQKINLNEKNTSIQKVLEKITGQSGYHFFYDVKDLSGVKVSLYLKDAEIETALGRCFNNKGIVFKIIGKNVILKQQETQQIPEKSVTAPAQSFLTISGKVTDDKGNLLTGINVRNKTTKKTTATQIDGSFSIAAERGDILILSAVGYQSQEQQIGVANYYTVMMIPVSASLEQVVVVGYGSTKRKDLTGSVVSVNVDEIKNVPFSTVDQALTGKAAGVQVTQSDGSPGGVAKIRIRGGTSLLGGNDPLYIIDGVQMQVQNRYIQSPAEMVSPVESFSPDGGGQSISGSFSRGLNSLGGLNINDIETIDILKDASATAIYGSKAANGVVIITTKKGRNNQKPVVEGNYFASVTTPVKERRLNREEYMMIIKEGAQNLNNARAAQVPALAPTAIAQSILNDPNYFGTANTDWLDLVLRKGLTQNADLSIRGGGTGSRYYTSLSYAKNEGTVLGTDFTKIAGKISLDNDINNRLRFNTNLDYGFTTNNITNGIYGQALFAPPTVDAYNPDGSVKIMTAALNGATGSEGFQNPLALINGVNRAKTFSLLGSLAGEYDILKSLKFRSSISINYVNYQQRNFEPSTAQISSGSTTTDSKRGIASEAQSQDMNIFYENTLTWNREFNANNRISFVAGTSWQVSRNNSFSASGQSFPDDVYLNNLSSAAITLPAKGNSGQNALLSFYARANYSLYDRYIFTFTGRSDASSKFPQDRRVGYFPSGGVAWRLGQENFIKKVKWINELKLRASAGYTGTQNIADNQFYTLYSPVTYAGLNGLTPSQLGNDQIKWESTFQKDLGLEFQFLNSRIRGEIGYYSKKTTGILFPATVASSSGFTSVTANLADIRNNGLELQIGGDFLRGSQWTWSGSLNISGNRSKVMALSNDFADPTNPKIYTYGTTILRIGDPVGMFYGYTSNGIIRTTEQLDAYKAQLPNWKLFFPYLGIGDGMYVINPATKNIQIGVIGKAEPKYYGGYTNTVTYKNIGLIALATFSYGGKVAYLADIQNTDLSRRTNKGIRILERYNAENPDSQRPRVLLSQNSTFGTISNQNLYDSSFIRLKSLTVNYQVSKKIMEKLKISQCSIYASTTNLFTITNYPGADPETSNNPYSLIGGYSDAGGYAAIKQFSLGIRLGL